MQSFPRCADSKLYLSQDHWKNSPTSSCFWWCACPRTITMHWKKAWTKWHLTWCLACCWRVATLSTYKFEPERRRKQRLKRRDERDSKPKRPNNEREISQDFHFVEIRVHLIMTSFPFCRENLSRDLAFHELPFGSTRTCLTIFRFQNSQPQLERTFLHWAVIDFLPRARKIVQFWNYSLRSVFVKTDSGERVKHFVLLHGKDCCVSIWVVSFGGRCVFKLSSRLLWCTLGLKGEPVLVLQSCPFVATLC